MTGHNSHLTESEESARPHTPPAESLKASAAEVDRSCCVPGLVFLTCASFWLLVGLLFGLLGSIKLHAAGFLTQSAWLTYGRVYPASLHILAYGFASQAGIGLALWLLARLSRATLYGARAVTVGALFWNLGVALGALGILAGNGTAHEWLEMPGSASPLLFFSYLLVSVWAVITFHFRRERELYASQWYLLAALFWFPWIFSTAELLLVAWPARGAVQAVVSGWYAHNFFNLWLAPIGLAAVFYFIPKILNRPLHSRYLAIFGFWTLVLFGGWGGLSAGAPVPRWVASAGIVAAVLIIVPLFAVALNWHWTLSGNYEKAWRDPALRFVILGAAGYLLSSVLSIVGALRSVNHVTQLTLFANGVTGLQLYGFFGLVLAGGIYYIVPRLTQREWPAPKFISLHFWAGSVGAILASLPLILGGLREGLALNDPNVPALEAFRSTLPFVGMNTLGLLLLVAAQGAFLANLAQLLWAWARSCCCLPASQSAPGGKPTAVGANV